MSAALLPMLAAAALSQPQLGIDFNRKATRNLPLQGTFMIELFIAPDGTVEDCEVAYEDSSRSGAEGFCKNARKLTAEQPARSSDGAPAYGTVIAERAVREFDSATPGGAPPKGLAPPVTRSADFEIKVRSLPEKFAGRLSVSLNVLVRADGSIAECTAAEPDLAAYGDAACAQLKDFKMQVRRSSADEAVPYVTDLKADFVAGAAAQT